MTTKTDMIMTSEALALGEQLCFAVYSAAHAFNRAYKPLLDRFGLTYPQYLVLLVLWQKDEITVKEIGGELGLDSGTLSPLLKRLETSGLVIRLRNTRDERQVLVRLTDKGRDMKTDAFGILADIGKATGCTMEEVAALRSELAALRSRLDGS